MKQGGIESGKAIDLKAFWIAWIVVTALGWATSFIVAWLTLVFIDGFTTVLIAEFSAGVAAGAAQWLLLRRRINHTAWWVPVTALGWGMTWIIFERLTGGPPEELGPTIAMIMETMRLMPPASHYATMGLVIGVGQFLVLRCRVSGAAWWIPATALGWWLAAVAGDFEHYVLATPFGYVQTELIGWTLMGTVVGAVTGLVLVLLLAAASKEQ